MPDSYKDRIQAILNRMEQSAFMPFRQEVEATLRQLPDGLEDFFVMAGIALNSPVVTPKEKRFSVLLCWLLGRLPKQESQNLLLATATHPEVEIAGEAIRALASFDTPFEVAPFFDLYHTTPHLELKTSILYMLYHVAGNPQIVEFLVEVMRDPATPLSLRGLAAEGLGECGTPAVVPTLLDQLISAPPELRYWIIFALGQLQDERALPLLEQLAQEDHTFVVEENKRISEEAKEAIANILAKYETEEDKPIE